jgi:Amt family ammonium transporter
MKRTGKFIGILLLVVIVLSLFAAPALAEGADSTGASYSLVTGNETLQDAASLASKAALGSNYVWVMICGFMVFFFQCGFAMVETGFCRGKNAAHTMTMNFMVFLVGAVGYFLIGFALQMGGSGAGATLGSSSGVLNSLLSIPGFGGILGYKGFLLSGTYERASTRSSSSRWCSWILPSRFRQALWRNASNTPL